MQEIPAGVREYLASDDALIRAQLLHINPNLKQTLEDPQTRTAILNWLASDEAWDSALSGFVLNCLGFLRSGAAVSEDQIVRTFLLHPDPYVRLRAYEFLLTLYFPDRNREAMFLLLHGMLSDSADAVRAQAVRYIERANAVAELRGSLERWYKRAQNLGWTGTESFELVEHLLKQ